MKTDNKTFYLVLRISGWSDKTEILELYDQKPGFDNCSKSNVDPIFGDSLESDQTITHVYLNQKDESLDIQYSPDAPEPTHNRNLKLEEH